MRTRLHMGNLKIHQITKPKHESVINEGKIKQIVTKQLKNVFRKNIQGEVGRAKVQIRWKNIEKLGFVKNIINEERVCEERSQITAN